MKIIIHYNDKEYVSKNNDFNSNECAEKFYDNISKLDSFKMELQDGSYMVCSKEMIHKSVFIFSD